MKKNNKEVGKGEKNQHMTRTTRTHNNLKQNDGNVNVLSLGIMNVLAFMFNGIVLQIVTIILLFITVSHCLMSRGEIKLLTCCTKRLREIKYYRDVAMHCGIKGKKHHNTGKILFLSH